MGARFRRTLAASVAVALLATGCGSGPDDTSVNTIGVLSAALADTAEASNYRVFLSAGVTFKLAGAEISADLDEQAPLGVGVVTSEREYYRFDVGAMLGLFSLELDDAAFEMWIDDDRVVFDISSIQRLVDASPNTIQGPSVPGVSFIDLTAIDADSPELMEAVAGASTPNLSEMAVSLPAALITIEQTSTDPLTFVGTTTSARLIQAQGGNVEADARSFAADFNEFGLGSSTDLDELTEAILQVYETNMVEVVIEVDERGLLSVLWEKEDMSGLFGAIAESENFGAGLSEEERQEAVELFGSVEIVKETRIAYEPDAHIEVPVPPSTAEDHTEEWLEFFNNSR